MDWEKTILVADDSADDLALMRRALKSSKCSMAMHEVQNGEEAIAYLKGEGLYRDRDAHPLPTVMLLDLNMPKKNGFDVLRWVRSRQGIDRLTIIVLTASSRSGDIERAFECGATSYLVKPSSLEALSAMIKCLCEWIRLNHFPPLSENK